MLYLSVINYLCVLCKQAPLKPDVDTQERNRQLQDFLDKVRTKRHVDTGGLSQSEREAKANKVKEGKMIKESTV